MKNLKITLLLTALLSIVGARAFAHDIEVANADGVTIYYVWTNNQTELAVSCRGDNYSNYSDRYSGAITIPESVTYNGKSYPVTSIGRTAFYACRILTSVTIPNSVTTIGDWAFDNCIGLTSVTIPNSVASIGVSAFRACSGLTSVTIPGSVTSISNYAFSGCSGLTSVTIPGSVTSIGKGVFSGCSELSNIFVELNNTTYDSRNDCNAIIETALNTLVAGCKNTTIPKSVTSIGHSAFSDCSGLTSITIPNSVTSIGESAFYGCSGLTSVTIPNSVTSICHNTFYNCTGLTSVMIPNSVTNIDSFAFGYCTSLTNITIPNSVSYIGGGAFSVCNGLTSLIIPNSVTDIGWYAFQGCSNLTSMTIPNSVTEIGKGLFQLCSGLKSVEIGNSVTSIGEWTFRDCSSLTSVTCYTATPPSLASNAFSDYTIPLYVPKGSVIKYKAADNWRNFVIIREISEEQDVYLSIRQANGSVNLKVDAEKPYFNLQIKADDGWEIHSVTLNEDDVTAEVASDGSYTTPVISSNSVLNIVFEKGSSSIVSQAANQMRVKTYGNTIRIEGAENNEQIAVYSAEGKLVKHENAEHGTATITLPENQTYIVKGQLKTVKVRL